MSTLPNNPTFAEKVEFIFGEMVKTRVVSIVTKPAIRRVLESPVKGRLTLQALTKINTGLTIPLSPEAVKEIMRLAEEYDKLAVVEAVKPPQPYLAYEKLPSTASAKSTEEDLHL